VPHLNKIDVVGSEFAFTVPVNIALVLNKFDPVGADVETVGVSTKVKLKIEP
jgi:hypothetical protein